MAGVSDFTLRLLFLLFHLQGKHSSPHCASASLSNSVNNGYYRLPCAHSVEIMAQKPNMSCAVRFMVSEVSGLMSIKRFQIEKKKRVKYLLLPRNCIHNRAGVLHEPADETNRGVFSESLFHFFSCRSSEVVFFQSYLFLI